MSSKGDDDASPSAKESQLEVGRTRSSRACQHCSKRKVKCDGEQPCKTCARDSIPCVYGTQKKRGPPKGCESRGGRRKKAAADDSKPSASTTSNGSAGPSSSSSSSTTKAARASRASKSITKSRQASASTSASASVPATALEHSSPSGKASANRAPHLDPVAPQSIRPDPRHELEPSTRSDSTTDPHDDTHSHVKHEVPRFDSLIAASPSQTSYPSDTRLVPSPGFSIPRSPINTSRSTLSSQPLPYTHSSPLYPSSHFDHQQQWTPYSHHHHHSHSLSHPASAPAATANDSSFRGNWSDSRSSPFVAQQRPLNPSSSSEGTSIRVSDRPAPSLPPTRNAPYPSPQSHQYSRTLYSGSLYPLASTSAQDRGFLSSVSGRHPTSASRLTDGLHAAVASAASPSSAYHASSQSPIANLPHPSTQRQPAPRDATSSASMQEHNKQPHHSLSTSSVHWPDRSNTDFLSSSHTNYEDHISAPTLQRLLDIYQAYVHPHWPIIYLPSISSLQSLRYVQPILFEAILAVASNTFDFNTDSNSDEYALSSDQHNTFMSESPSSHSEPPWKPSDLSTHFVQRVKKRIFDGKFEQSLSTIQASILISVVDLGCGNTSSAFQFGGIACRMALDMNLHRCTSSGTSAATIHSVHRHSVFRDSEPRRSNSETQERLRVFWACFILDKILSTVLDKPAQLRSAEIEAEWPSTQEADEFNLWLNEVTGKFVQQSEKARFAGVKVHALSSFKAWAEVMAILERILEEVYSPQAKRDRRRTGGESDYNALLKLNDRLVKWRAELPEHLRWQGTWTSPDFAPSGTAFGTGDRPGVQPHRILPPQILTMRAWYCICLILLHRPRVPKLLESPRPDNLLEHDLQQEAETTKSNTGSSMRHLKVSPHPFGGSSPKPAVSSKSSLEPAGLEICNAAAKEVCDILHVYDTTFRIRKISSSWVYLIFQSATIHAAIAAKKSVIAFKARQDRLGRRESTTAGLARSNMQAPFSPVTTAGDDDAGPRDAHGGGSHPDSIHDSEPELEGSSDLVKTSALYLAECVRFLKRIGSTWQSAANHVQVLRRLCIASAQTRPASPAVGAAASPMSHLRFIIADESEPSSGSSHRLGRDGAGSASLYQHHGAHPQQLLGSHPPIGQSPRSANAVGHPGFSDAAHQHEQRGFSASSSNLGHHDALQRNGYSDPAFDQEPGSLLPSVQQQQQQHPQNEHQQGAFEPQPMQSINANDWTFWASMPVASEGAMDWDDFLKVYNPSATTDFTAQSNYNPAAAVDLITAFQDPNRLLNSFHPSA